MREKLETLSVSVLKEFAKDKNIKNISAMRKSELIELFWLLTMKKSRHIVNMTKKKQLKKK